MDRETWQATTHEVVKSQKWLRTHTTINKNNIVLPKDKLSLVFYHSLTENIYLEVTVKKKKKNPGLTEERIFSRWLLQ